MSEVTNELLEKLKTLTLLDAVELVSQIEETFGVDATASRRGGGRIIRTLGIDQSGSTERSSEKATFDVILESIADDKRIARLKVVRSLTNLGLKEAKDFCSALPKAVKENISKEEAEIVRKELEQAGGRITIKLKRDVLV
jgi:large subunit ribosomal protein L7/L12